MGICCRLRLHLIWLVLANSLIIANSHCQEAAILIVDGDADINLTPYISILRDQKQQLSLDRLTQQPQKHPFTKLTNRYLAAETGSSRLWVKLKLRAGNSYLKPINKIVHVVRHPISDRILFYESLTNGEFREVITGRMLPWGSRDIEAHSFAFNVTLNPKQDKTIYLAFDADRSRRVIPLVLKSEKSYAKFEQWVSHIAIIFYTIIITLFIYNLLLWCKVREKAQLVYLAYILAFTAMVLTGDGLLQQLIQVQFSNRSLPPLNTLAVYATITNALHVVLIFKILHLGKHLPALIKPYQFFLAIQTGLAIAYMLNLVSDGLSHLGSINFLIGWAISITVILIAVRHKIPCSKSLLLAETFMVCGPIFFVSANFGIGPVNAFTLFAVGKTAFAGHMVLFSLVLGDRVQSALSRAFEYERISLQAETKNLEIAADKDREVVAAQKKAIEAYESSLKLKNDFITAISHELRTPMNGIIGGLQLMQKNPQQQLSPPLDIVQNSAIEMMGLVNDILTHTEIQAGKIHVCVDNIDISHLLLESRLHYQNQCFVKGLQLSWKIDADIPQSLSLDGDKFITIFSKLLDNAVKFTEHGMVSFDLGYQHSQDPAVLICTVTDTGIGIPADQQNLIFESFEQMESGFQRRYNGLGIGLSICKKLTQKLGGNLKLSSTLGGGSSFEVTLPVQPADSLGVETGSGIASADLPILVVEDNIINQQIIEKLLQKLGYKTVLAGHGVDAIQVLSEQEVSLILMDLQMPVMDGFSCTEKIRARQDTITNIPIIAVTANLMDTDKQQCLQSGMNDFLKKPVKLETLRDSLLRYIAPGKTPID